VPLTKSLELSAAARYDHYNDVGGSFNPKLGLRWEASKQLMFRTSYNTGFRAPTLYDLHGLPPRPSPAMPMTIRCCARAARRRLAPIRTWPATSSNTSAAAATST
jgi:hypothetical protein